MMRIVARVGDLSRGTVDEAPTYEYVCKSGAVGGSGREVGCLPDPIGACRHNDRDTGTSIE